MAETKQQIKTGVYGISVSCAADGGGTISSDLRSPNNGPEALAAIDALESLVLAHACSGIDICSPAYLEGIETAVDAITNRVENDRREAAPADMPRDWRCDECGWTTCASYETIAEIGTPMCSECDIEMTLLD